MTIHAVILPDSVAVSQDAGKAIADMMIERHALALQADIAAVVLKILVDAQPHVTTTDRDGAIVLAKEHGARLILIEGKRLQVVTSHVVVEEGETAGAPAKAPEPPRKRYNPTKAEVNARIAADAERFKAAVAIGTPLEHLKNPHRPSSRAGQAWAALVRAHEEKLRAVKVDGAAPAVGK